MPVPFPLTRRAAFGASLGAVVGLALALAHPHGAHAQASGEPVRLGELNSYSNFAAFTVPYRQGFEMAFEEINEAGGVLGGRPIEVLSRDDGASPADATRVAEELVTREGVSLIFGSLLSNVGVALADFAAQREIPYIAAEPLSDALTMEQGNRFTYRIRPSTYMQVGMLVEAAKASGAKRWAIVAPNYEYGQSAAADFEKLLLEAIPDAEIVAEQYPALNRIDAGATVSAIEQSNPDGIFNVLFGADLVQFVRQGETRGLFEDRTIVSLLTGEPEWNLPLGEEVPDGWIVTGYPWQDIEEEEHRAFIAAYQERWDETPRLGSLLGYVVANMIADAIETAGSTETEAILAAFEGATFDTVIGEVSIRPEDNQADMGAWVGLLEPRDGVGAMREWSYKPGAPYMPPLDVVRAARPDL
ncbi:ABC transporter substrate-binding protein [Salinarimonas ramus]|uniref:Twin-arginine translocation pathway signal protein n=1 Tax=Salinarimonas ramus TaxID=690164 RepID=A0A917V5R0_9HYPH|nr:ABC transporter substrate-binding protein [Salinarimonas ramus]GGK41706.1 twin-arginine translocation pathway signal protein [Salinarimonas ramus]